MIKENWSLCTGCGCCKAICPKGAIEMQKDAQGFFRPVIDKKICVECGLCKTICPINPGTVTANTVKSVYSAYITNEDVLISSSSGGMFSCLANFVLNLGGSVYGAVFNSNWSVKHVRAENYAEIAPMRGSKYLQSYLQNDIYIQIATDLHNNRYVLFTGTPCQCSAVRSYLQFKKIDTEKLYLAEILCDGVNSPGIWQEYLSFMFKGSSITDVNFRSKINGWKKKTIALKYINETESGAVEKSYVKTYDDDYFAQLFGNHLILRPSCYECRYSSLNRVSDITIGDFWADDKLTESKRNRMGLSLVLLNTEKGIDLFDSIKELLIYADSTIDIATLKQGSLKQPPFKNKHYQQFWNTYYKYGLSAAMKCSTTYGFKGRLKKKIKSILKG